MNRLFLNIIDSENNKLKWNAVDKTSGSYNIYRSDKKFGTYSLIGSLDLGSTEYTDSTGSSYAWYKITYTNGSVESLESNKVSPLMFKYFSDVQDVRKVSEFLDLSDDEIYEFIKTADLEITSKHGYPLTGGYTYTNLESERYSYNLKEVPESLYRLDEVYIGSSKLDSNLGSYLVDYERGIIYLGSDIVDNNVGENIYFIFVPEVYSLISKYKTVYNILVGHDIIRSGEIVANKSDIMKKMIDELESNVEYPKIILSTQNVDKLKYVEQITLD